MEINNDIWSKLRDIAKNINPDDVVKKPNKSYCENYKYKTKIKWGWFFKERDVMKLRI